jgi:hypothetical protein
MARIPNQDLINLRNTFGVDPEYLLSDLNDYTMDAPVEEVNDGLASLNTGLPTYTQDGDGGNNFLQYSDESAPAYIRPTEIAETINQEYELQDPTIMKMANFDELFGPKTFTDNLGNVRTVPGEERFTLPEEKIGILQSIKNKGTGLLDFIRGGGITGNILRGLGSLEQNPTEIFMRDYYGGEDGSNIKDGTIQSGLMAGYNPVSGGFLNMISGGRFGRPTNYGLQRAYQKRIDMISKNLKDNKYRDPRKQIEKLKKLEEEQRKEAEILKKTRLERLGRDKDRGGFDPSGPTQASIRSSREDRSGRGQSGGFTNPGKGSYGPFS